MRREHQIVVKDWNRIWHFNSEEIGVRGVSFGEQSKPAGEGLVQQRLFQRRQRRQLLLVEACEALGFGGEGAKLADDGSLVLGRRRKWNGKLTELRCIEAAL